MKSLAASTVLKGKFDETRLQDEVTRLRKELDEAPTCAFCFFSVDYAEHVKEVCEVIQYYGHAPRTFGCTGTGVSGTAQEVEFESSISVLLLSIPNGSIETVEVSQAELEGEHDPAWWHSKTGCESEDLAAWLMLVDPISLDVEEWLRQWNKAYPGVSCIGGLASANAEGNEYMVFSDGQEIESGGLAIAIRGDVEVLPMVSQGCRPMGEPLTITQTEHNLILNLGGKTAFEVLSELLGDMSEDQRERARGNVFAGLAMSEYVDEFKRGDFLVRNILGADPSNGAVSLGAIPRVGQTMQYQLRDRISAMDDMNFILQDFNKAGVKPYASLLFTCTGRGEHLFGEKSHDAQSISRVLGKHPAAGFSCNGELGPVAGVNHVHGYTACAALFVEKKAE